MGSELTLTVSAALSADAVEGLNVTAIVHDEFPARFGPQVPPVIVKSPEFGPVTLLPIERAYGE